MRQNEGYRPNQPLEYRQNPYEPYLQNHHEVAYFFQHQGSESHLYQPEGSCFLQRQGSEPHLNYRVSVPIPIKRKAFISIKGKSKTNFIMEYHPFNKDMNKMFATTFLCILCLRFCPKLNTSPPSTLALLFTLTPNIFQTTIILHI